MGWTKSDVGHSSGTVLSPGRVNLLGEHVDYNRGLVLPVAIDQFVSIKYVQLSQPILHLEAHDLAETCEIQISKLDHKVDINQKPLPGWALYPAGVVWNLVRFGFPVPGFSAQYWSDIPIGAGLSSSAAVEVGFGVVCQALGGWELDRPTLAQLCQQAEIEYVGVNCGVMDQFICANGVEDHALFLDTRNLDFRAIPLPPETTLVIADSTVRRTLVNSAYNERRAECEKAVALLKVVIPGLSSLRDVTPEQFTDVVHMLPTVIAQRAQHVVGEIERVAQAVNFLEQKDAVRFGNLMFKTHASLRDLFEVSCSELDLLVSIAASIDGCLGARLTGGGFGGCTVNLVREEATDKFMERLNDLFSRETGLIARVFLARSSAGARLMP